MLRGFLGAAGHQVVVDYAMRYGQPSIPATLSRLKAEGCTRILLMPLYPQYSSSTAATAFDAAFAWPAKPAISRKSARYAVLPTIRRTLPRSPTAFENTG